MDADKQRAARKLSSFQNKEKSWVQKVKLNLRETAHIDEERKCEKL